MTPEELVDTVDDEESFLKFADALQKDRELSVADEAKKPSSPYGPAARGWENISIERFLEAAVSWSSDSNFGKRMFGEISPWRKFALFLLAGKGYE